MKRVEREEVMSASKQGPVRGACSIMESRTTTSCGKGGGWEKGEREKGEGHCMYAK